MAVRIQNTQHFSLHCTSGSFYKIFLKAVVYVYFSLFQWMCIFAWGYFIMHSLKCSEVDTWTVQSFVCITATLTHFISHFSEVLMASGCDRCFMIKPSDQHAFGDISALCWYLQTAVSKYSSLIVLLSRELSSVLWLFWCQWFLLQALARHRVVF